MPMSRRYVPRDGEPKSLRGAWVTGADGERIDVSSVEDDTGEDIDVTTLDEDEPEEA